MWEFADASPDVAYSTMAVGALQKRLYEAVSVTYLIANSSYSYMKI
jgi:hypothetical protein